jgi:hypothetical protein
MGNENVVRLIKKHNAVFYDDLWCYVERIEYEPRTRCGHLWLPEHNCPDMSGTIKLFERIDDRIVRIETYAGNRNDVRYQKQHDGEWVALLYQH